jgi:hypothetical protein
MAMIVRRRLETRATAPVIAHAAARVELTDVAQHDVRLERALLR